MFQKHVIPLSALLAVGLLGGCAGTKPAPESPQDPIAVRLAFQPAIGMERAAVESLLGEPSHRGRTKEGHLHCMYLVGVPDEMIYRSVIYDADGKVIRWYR